MGIISTEKKIIEVKLELSELARKIIERCYSIAFGNCQNENLSVTINTGSLSDEQKADLELFMEDLTSAFHDFCIPIEEHSGLRVGRGVPYKIRLMKELVSSGMIDSRRYCDDKLKFNVSFKIVFSEQVADERIIISENSFVESAMNIRVLSEYEYDLYDDDDEAGLERENIIPTLLSYSGRESRPGMYYDTRNGNWVNDASEDDYDW